MKTTINLILFLALAWNTANAQVGIGTTTPKDDAALEVASSDKGVLFPRMTSSERDAIASPAQGLVIYNTDTDCLQWYDGSFWYDGCSGLDGPDPLPGNITLEQVSAYYIASADDDDYLDNTGDLPNNTTEAQLPGTAADDEADAATTETAIDIQGTLPQAGVTINIPYEVVTAPTTLPAFEQTITIPAEYIQGGTSAVDVKFSYPEQTNLAVGTGVVPATLQAVGSNLDVIKFDLNSGFGANYLGFLLGKFVYALDSAGTLADLEVRGIPGIPDKNISDPDHKFVYLPITSTPTGKTWLNNNLGANYANINNTAFDPAQQATGSTDADAYGNYFQWGRDGDGHEFPGSTPSAGPVTAGNEGSNFITSGSDWLTPSDDNRWNANETTGGAVVKTANDPCPNGYRVPTEAEWQAEITDGGWSNDIDALNSDLALPSPGRRFSADALFYSEGDDGYYWTSTSARPTRFNNSVASFANLYDADGYPVRCIQE